MKRFYKLKGVVQHYSWGGTSFIPELLSVSNPEQKPFGEYWLGAHPNAPALLEEENVSLLRFIKENPTEVLGEAAAESFGSLPYLFKILDVRQMLSIQVHPSKAAAEEEFEKENEKGVPLTAPHRNYKDRNHKPELMVALSDFWLLHGFKGKKEMEAIFEQVPELSRLQTYFHGEDYRQLYEAVMTMPQRDVDSVLLPLLERILPEYEKGALRKSREDFWAARAAQTFCKNNSYDRGIFSVYFFNLLHLKKGEAIYQPAGLPHAYLEGQNVEVMANSDNVLRAGLTDKHVDVPELMKHVKFEPTVPKIIPASDAAEQRFDAPVAEFHLKKYTTSNNAVLTPLAATILFVIEGEGVLKSKGEELHVNRGEAALLIPGPEITVAATNGAFSFYQVSTPPGKNN